MNFLKKVLIMKILKNKLLFILCFIFLMIPNAKALEEGEIKLFDDFTYNNNVIKGFTYRTDMQYLTVYCARNTTYNYYNWTPKDEIIPNYTIIANSNSGYIELHIQMLNYQYNSYGWQYINYNKKLILQKINWKDSSGYNQTYRWLQREEDGTYSSFTTSYSNNMNRSDIIFKYDVTSQEWILITDQYTHYNNYKSHFLRDASQYYMVLLENKTSYNVKIIQTNMEVLDSNYNQVEFDEYKETKPTRNIPTANYSLGCDENNPFIYNIYFNIENLEKNDNVKIYKKDKLLKDIKYVYEPNKTETITIENAETSYYKIDVYDENNELLYSATFHINVEIGDIFDENDTPVTLLDKIKMYLKGFKNNINMFYKGFENFFSSLNFELRTGIFIITTIFIIVYIIKIIL